MVPTVVPTVVSPVAVTGAGASLLLLMLLCVAWCRVSELCVAWCRVSEPECPDTGTTDTINLTAFFTGLQANKTNGSKRILFSVN